MKTALVFPGQGSQFPGMGKELYDNFETCRSVFNTADEALGFSISERCFSGEGLNDTEYAQPALLTHSMACYALLREKNHDGEFYTGLSLGEYSALCAAGVFSLSEAVKLVHKRGRFMAEAAPQGFGGMSAIMGLSEELCRKACYEASSESDNCYCANFNMPGQIVIAGENDSLARAEELCAEYGARRVIRLNVSGPFHTPYMAPAAAKLELELAKISPREAQKPVISNLTAMPHDEKKLFPNLLAQMQSPVLFEKIINYLVSEGVGLFIELGAGKTLEGFIRKINRSLNVLRLEEFL